ncbi:MAG: S8 family serine peptidase [Euryarchaeota archaeon]|nr:S8 family serine peptidase [Euryarchaeota archaeon]
MKVATVILALAVCAMMLLPAVGKTPLETERTLYDESVGAIPPAPMDGGDQEASDGAAAAPAAGNGGEQAEKPFYSSEIPATSYVAPGDGVTAIPGLTNWSARDAHRVPQAAALGINGTNVVVGVADTGVDFCNIELQKALLRDTNPSSPYNGWPVAFDSISLRSYLAAREVSGSNWYSNTSANGTGPFEYFKTIKIDGRNDFSSRDIQYLSGIEIEDSKSKYWDGNNLVGSYKYDFDLKRMMASRDFQNWYIGFDSRFAQVNKTFGIYIDVDNTTSGGTIDPAGYYIDTDAAHTNTVDTLAYHPGRDLLASAAEGKKDSLDNMAPDNRAIWIWNRTGVVQRIITGPTEAIHSLAWSPDGNYLIGADKLNTYIWNANTWALLYTIDTTKTESIKNGLSASKTNSWIAIPRTTTQLFKVINYTTGLNVTETSAGGDVYGVAFSNAGDKLAVGLGNGAIKIYLTSDFSIDSIIPSNDTNGHSSTYPIRSLTWSLDDSKLASAGDDGRLLLWDVGGVPSKLEGWLTFANPGTYAISNILWDATKIVVGSSNGNLTLINPSTYLVTGEIDNRYNHRVSAISYGETGNEIYVGSTDASIRLYNTGGGPYVPYITHKPDMVIYIDFQAETFKLDDKGKAVIDTKDKVFEPRVYMWNATSNTWNQTNATNLEIQYFYKGFAAGDYTGSGFMELGIPRRHFANYSNGGKTIDLKLFSAERTPSVPQDMVPEDPNMAPYVDFTSTQTRSMSWFGRVEFNENKINSSAIPVSKSVPPKYHFGYHPSETLGKMVGDENWPGVLVVDANTAGVYDTVIVDMNADYVFDAKDPIATKANPFVAYDPSGDGIPDESGGIVYFIGNGKDPIPYSQRIAELQKMTFSSENPMPIPQAGEIVCLFGEFEYDADHSVPIMQGSMAAAIIAGRGNQSNDYGKRLGIAPSVKLVATARADLDMKNSITFLSEGYNLTDPSDNANIIYIGASASSFNSGLDDVSQFIDYMAVEKLNNTVTFIVPAGDDGPGYGTIASPAPHNAIVVGAATDNAYNTNEFILQHVYGEPATYSSRGPSAGASAKPDLLAVGNAFVTLPLLQQGITGDHPNNNDEMIGSVVSAAVTAGVAALTYEAYVKKYATAPDRRELTSILMSTADDVSYDVLSQGAGYLNAEAAVRFALGLDGLSVRNNSFVPDIYYNNNYASYPEIMPPGSSASENFTAKNIGAATNTNVLAENHVAVWSAVVNHTFVNTTEPLMVNLTAMVSQNVSLLKIKAMTDAAEFYGQYVQDNKTLYNPSPIEEYEMSFVASDGTFVDKTDYESNVLTLEMSQPLYKLKAGLWLKLDCIMLTNTTTWTIYFTGYYPQSWSWLSVSGAPTNIGGGATAGFTATANVPQGALPGSYSGAIKLLSKPQAVADETLYAPKTESVTDETVTLLSSTSGILDHGNDRVGTLSLWNYSPTNPEVGWVSYRNDAVDNNAVFVTQSQIPMNTPVEFSLPYIPAEALQQFSWYHPVNVLQSTNSSWIISTSTGTDAFNLGQPGVVNCTLYAHNTTPATTHENWALLTEGIDYNITLTTGDITLSSPWMAIDGFPWDIYPFYNITDSEQGTWCLDPEWDDISRLDSGQVPLGVIGDGWDYYNLSGPGSPTFLNCSVWVDNTGTWLQLVEGIDYTVDLRWSSITLNGIVALVGLPIYVYYNGSADFWMDMQTGYVTVLNANVSTGLQSGSEFYVNFTHKWLSVNPVGYSLDWLTGIITFTNPINPATDIVTASYTYYIPEYSESAERLTMQDQLVGTLAHGSVRPNEGVKRYENRVPTSISEEDFKENFTILSTTVVTPAGTPQSFYMTETNRPSSKRFVNITRFLSMTMFNPADGTTVVLDPSKYTIEKNTGAVIIQPFDFELPVGVKFNGTYYYLQHQSQPYTYTKKVIWTAVGGDTDTIVLNASMSGIELLTFNGYADDNMGTYYTIIEGVDYTADYSAGTITFLGTFGAGWIIRANYTYLDNYIYRTTGYETVPWGFYLPYTNISSDITDIRLKVFYSGEWYLLSDWGWAYTINATTGYVAFTSGTPTAGRGFFVDPYQTVAELVRGVNYTMFYANGTIVFNPGDEVGQNSTVMVAYSYAPVDIDVTLVAANLRLLESGISVRLYDDNNMTTATLAAPDYTIYSVTGGVFLKVPLAPWKFVNISYTYYAKTTTVPVLINVGAGQTSRYEFGGPADNTLNSPTSLGGGNGQRLSEEELNPFSGDRRYFYVDIPPHGLHLDTDNVKTLLNVKWQDVPTDIDASVFGRDQLGASGTTAPFSLAQVAKGPPSQATALYMTSSGGANETITGTFAPELNVVMLRARVLNGSKEQANFTGNGGMLVLSDKQPRMSTKEMSGEMPVTFTSNLNFTDGMIASVVGPASGTKTTEEAYADVLLPQETYEDWFTLLASSKFTKVVKVEGALSLDVHIIGDDQCPDLDLAIFKDGYKTGVEDGEAQWNEIVDKALVTSIDAYKSTYGTGSFGYCGDADADEAVKLIGPPDGNYIVKVLGYTVTGSPGHFTLDIKTIRKGVEGFNLGSNLEDYDPANSIVLHNKTVSNFTTAEFDVLWNFPPASSTDGSYGGILSFGTNYSREVLVVPIDIVLDRQAPRLTSQTPAEYSKISDPRQRVACVYDDSEMGEIDKGTLKIYLDGLDITGIAKASAEKSANTAGTQGVWAGSIVFDPQYDLAEGGHIVKAMCGDQAGNLNEAVWGFTVDTNAPMITMEAPASDVSVPNGTFAVKGRTNDPGATVRVFVGSIEYQVGMQTDNAFVSTVTLLDGSNELIVTATDGTGNMANLVRRIVLDDAGPTIKDLTTSTSSVTSQPFMYVMGKASEAGSVSVNGVPAVLQSDYTISHRVDLSEGANVVKITVSDLAGNSESYWRNITRDTVAPQIALNDVPTKTTSSAIDISGRAESGTTVYVNGKQTNVSSDGRFTVTGISLSYGANAITVTAKDRAGNEAQRTLTLSYEPARGTNWAAICLMIGLLAIGLTVGILLWKYMGPKPAPEAEVVAEAPPVEGAAPVEGEAVPAAEGEAPPVEGEAAVEPGAEAPAEPVPAEEAKPEETPAPAEPVPGEPKPEAPAEPQLDPVKQERIAKLRKALDDGKISKELYDRNVERVMKQ